MLLLFYTIAILSVNAQTTCGAYHTRCNGSFGPYSFYTCCDTGLVCKPYDTYGGSCEYGPNYTTPPVAPTMVNILPGCGVLYTRCNGSFCGYDFYPCCQPGLVCVPYDTYGGTCAYGPVPLSTAPPLVCVARTPPTDVPTNGGAHSEKRSSMLPVIVGAFVSTLLLSY